MQSIKFKMTGVCPLMLNNPQTVNPMNEYAKALKELTSKRSKTDDDQNEIFHLKFLASCYVNNKGQYIIPANMISKSFEAGAKENKLGAKFQRSVFVFTDAVLKFDENGIRIINQIIGVAVIIGSVIMLLGTTTNLLRF